MQDVPIECSIDASEIEQMACETPKSGQDGGMTTQQVPPKPSPTPTPKPSPK